MNIIDRYDAYIKAHLNEKEPFITHMEEYAEENRVPIMESVGIESLIGLLRIQKPKNVLEIGSAIGYSAIRIATALKETKILTIERDAERYTKAVENILQCGLTKRIQIIEADALEIELDKVYNETFDALFIDAAKGQYQRFFEKYTPFLNSNGVIYCDNIFMHGMVLREDTDVPKRSRTMIRKLKEFTRWVMSHPEYDSVLLPIGDGLLIATKKQEIL
ncbi:O-methyltransferase [Sporosarcina sp. FA9]|uniref:O-methyltransferase n=1 Tax=Sporosarcina sp. FA9 TaxID=3413030 RepID=UPI003F65C1BE